MKKLIFALLTVVLAIGIATAKESLLDTYNMNRAYEEGNKGNHAGALDFFDKELKEHPKNGYAHLGKAAIFFEQKQYDGVISSTDNALRLIPKKDKTMSARAHLLKGQTLLATADTVSALSEMTEAIRLEPKFTDAYDKRGQVYYEQMKYDLADADYKKLIELNSADLMGYMGLGRNCQAKGQLDEAIRLFNKVAGMYPYYSSAFAFRAESYLAKNEYLKAIDDICRALEIDSDSKAYGLMYKFPKEQMELIAIKLKGLSAKDPYTGEYYYYTGLLYAHHKVYDKSNDALEKGYDIDARACFIQQLAENSQKTGDYNSALNYIEKAQQMSPDDIDLIHMKADMLGELGDIDGAIAEWSKYVDKTPDYFGGYYRRGWFKDISMQTDAAIEDYKMAVMLQPDYAYAHFGLADMLMRKGEIDQAKEEYRKVIELDSIPNNESCAMYALLALDRKDDAISYMNKILENDTADAGNYYDAACFYSRIGDVEMAINHLKTTLDKGFKRFYHIRHDDDLEELRKMPNFEEIMAIYEKPQTPITESRHSDEIDSTMAYTDPVEIPFTTDGGCASVKCTINELPLNFIFDTGASIVSISQLEANFMLKNGYLKREDFAGPGRFIDANGNISEGSIVNLRSVDFGGLQLDNVQASVVHNQKAPLLLGQSVLGRLGRIEIDNSNKKLIITKSL
ncbi:tetratricopeptide repeat protein [uncultured Muribaculum sp.]|uniref:tetratricopeptide repeat protein n=1 Tax=uncultured Muribaculum sp. TaxID=1918613 RepID=UPI002730EC7F|nr:tetratricopeptide repeat protein [uncultured Muribaculum sp.]